MPDKEKVIKGLYLISLDTRLKGFRASGELYHDVATDALALLKEYDEALKLMVYQYCTMAPLTISDEIFHNQYMSAGEAAFRLLGIENGQSTDGVWERWFPNG